MVNVNILVTILPFASAVLAWTGPVPRLEVRCVCRGVSEEAATKATENACAEKASQNQWMSAILHEDGYCAMWNKDVYEPSDAERARMFDDASDEELARFEAFQKAELLKDNNVNAEDISIDDCEKANAKCDNIEEVFIQSKQDEIRVNSERMARKLKEAEANKKWKWLSFGSLAS